MDYKNNGRIDLSESVNTTPFQLYDKIHVKENDSFHNALIGNVEETTLSRIFFSSDNTNNIQNAIRAGVYEKSNNQYIIEKQNADSLHTIMQNMYYEYGGSLSENDQANLNMLNKKVIDYCVPVAYNAAESYMKYKRDISTLAVPISNPRVTRDEHSLEYKQY